MLRLFIDVFSLGQLPVLYVLRQQKLIFNIGIFMIVYMLVTQVVFTYLFGVTGMILSVLTATFTNALIREYILRTRFNYPVFEWSKLWTFDNYDRMILDKIKHKIFKIKPKT